MPQFQTTEPALTETVRMVGGPHKPSIVEVLARLPGPDEKPILSTTIPNIEIHRFTSGRYCECRGPVDGTDGAYWMRRLPKPKPPEPEPSYASPVSPHRGAEGRAADAQAAGLDERIDARLREHGLL